MIVQMFNHVVLLGSLFTIGFIQSTTFNRSYDSEKIFDLALDHSGKVSMHWKLDYRENVVQFEIHFPLEMRWFAFGFSDYGEFAPADYCIYWTDWKNRIHFEDTHSDNDGFIFRDVRQDCLNFRKAVENGIVKFAFTRKFDTCDKNDYVIEDGTTHIVWSSGTNVLYDIQGLNILKSGGKHSDMVHTQLLKNIHIAPPMERNLWHLDVATEKVHVPSTDTTYWCRVQRLPETLRKKHHIIQFEPLLQKGNEGLAHHIEVFHCIGPVDEPIPDYEGSCFDEKRPNKTQVCKKVLAAWAMGAQAFPYPQEAGLPIGGPDFNPYVMLEVHYNNPELKSDWVDSSGIRFTITSKLRKYDAGVIELGLEYTDKMAIPQGQERFSLTGYCIAECTEVGLPPEGIVIFGSQLHTHLKGIGVYTKHVRNGRELPELNRDNHYLSHFQEIRRLKRPVHILPGDALLTTCDYKTASDEKMTLGGFAITDEMCVNYVHYYPAISLEVCKSSISDHYLHEYFKFMHDYDNQSTSDSNGISDNYKSIEWTPLRSAMLADYYNHAPLSMQCNMSGGDRFPGNWENMQLTTIDVPLPEPIKNC